jgi:hypothetical protein
MTKNEIPCDFGDEIFVFMLFEGKLLTLIPTVVNKLSESNINENYEIYQCFKRDDIKLKEKIKEWIDNPKLTYKELFNLKD